MVLKLESLREMRSRKEGGVGGARKAMAKSCEEEGEQGVTMIAGSGDFSVASGRERSMIVISVRVIL